MKKVLFATTALVATASVAAADVTFSGYGRFGVQYTGSTDAVGAGATAANDVAAANQAAVNVAGATTAAGLATALADLIAANTAVAASAAVAATGSSMDVTSRLRLQIDMSAESEGGITFGARTRLQTSEGSAGTGMNGVRFFARSGGVEVGVGNIFGALEFMPGMYPIDLGLTGLGYDYTAYNFRADAYSSAGNGASGSNGVEVMYSAGDFSAHVSASDTSDRIAAHFAYKMNGFTFALGAQNSDSATDTELAASVGGTFGMASVTLSYADNGISGDHTVLAGSFDVGAATKVQAYIADADYFTDTSYGIGVHQDLGGGTSIRGGVASLGSGNSRADVGVRFNF